MSNSSSKSNNSNNNPGQAYSNATLLQYVKTKWGSEPPSTVVAKIAKGDRLATEALGLSPNATYRSQVVQVGAVDAILEFLLQTNKPFYDVLPAAAAGNSRGAAAGYHPIPCPSIWVNLLNNFCQDGFLQPLSLSNNIQYKIILNLGPLFQDMSNLEQRRLFGSNDTWIKSLNFFTNLLFTLISTKQQPRISEFVLKQSLLPKFLVRILCLPLASGKSDDDPGDDDDTMICREIQDFSQHREDRFPKPDILGTARTFCACAIKTIWTKYGPSNPTIIEMYAGIPIRPEHELRLMTAILPLLQLQQQKQISSEDGVGWYQGGYSATLTLFLILFDKAERLSGPFGVDSASEIIVQVCRHHLAQFAPLNRDKYFLENILTGLVTIGATLMTPVLSGKQAPVDYNVAKAVRAGLIDYFIECCDVNDPRISTTLQGSIRTIGATVILDETQQALHELAPAIQAKMERILGRHPVLLPPLNSLNELMKNPMIKAEPNPDEEACAFCQEKMINDETQQQQQQPKSQKCPFCKAIVYCSKDCQRLNWMIHQMDCASKRKEPVAQSPEQLLQDGKNCFSLHISKILLQAALKGISILDCIVVIDMCEYTPVFMTYTLEQFASAYIQDEDAVTLSEKVMKRNKGNGALTVSFIGFSDTEGFNGNLMTFPPDTAPPMPSVQQVPDTEKWIVAQREVARSALGPAGAGAQMQKNPRLWQGALMKTMKP